ncbi:hypothetical protein T4B_5642 [Trichinella pseudospiralis]|uniref:Uncharacterized protein n=1 Tax=Trichinella pseudospiralis TaxID=6337 RepID=A0A0V1IF32_TRIPS|nr:hypothetical protein T4B_5642 [Trichinella pseudospiralis]
MEAKQGKVLRQGRDGIEKPVNTVLNNLRSKLSKSVVAARFPGGRQNKINRQILKCHTSESVILQASACCHLDHR